MLGMFFWIKDRVFCFDEIYKGIVEKKYEIFILLGIKGKCFGLREEGIF